MQYKAYDIIFYYPQHFNRSKQGSNSLFDPLIDICKTNNLHYLVIEEPDKITTFPRNKKALKFDIYFYIILVLRKVIPLFLFRNTEKKEQWIGNAIKNITGSKFNSKVILTLSNSMGGFWRGYNSNSKIIDYQHGIIDKNQSGFFHNGKATLQISENNKEIAVWGTGFYNVFNQDKAYYKDKVYVIGHPQLSKNKKNSKFKNQVIFSLQFVEELSASIKQEMLNKIHETLTELNTLSDQEKPNVVLIKHPRHNESVDLTPLLNKFQFISIIEENQILSEENCFLHVTFCSTTAFEMAMKKVPTYFLITENFPHANIFLKDYNYPIPQNTTLKELITLYQNNKEIRDTHGNLLKKWKNHYFEPINKDAFLKMINIKIQ